VLLTSGDEFGTVVGTGFAGKIHLPSFADFRHRHSLGAMHENRVFMRNDGPRSTFCRNPTDFFQRIRIQSYDEVRAFGDDPKFTLSKREPMERHGEPTRRCLACQVSCGQFSSGLRIERDDFMRETAIFQLGLIA